MNVEIEETGPVERKLVIEIPTSDVDAAFDTVYRAVRKSARLPGFRKGKVPLSLVQQRFGEQARGDVLERLVQESFPKALKDSALDVIGEPRLEAGEPPSEGEPYSYAAIVDIRPRIELARVRGLEVTGPELPQPEEEPVDAHLEQLRMQQVQLIEEDEGASAARGHVAVIDYDATAEGKPFEGGSGKETAVDLGEGRTIPGLEDELIGLEVGGEREFDLELPEGYPVESVAGKQARFHVKLVGLKRRELPEIDDEFAKDVSEFETLEALRASLQERLDRSREREIERLTREAVVDALIAANPFDVPASLVERQLQVRINRAAGQLQQLPPEQLQELATGWREEWRPAAERDVRLALLVPVIAESEEFSVSDEELDQELAEAAEQRGEPVAQLKRSYREQGYLDVLRDGLLERRVVDFLVSEATVSGP